MDVPAVPALPRHEWRAAVRASFGESDHFGRLALQGLSGHFLRRPLLPRPWSALAEAAITSDEWRAAIPAVLRATEGDSGPWERLKNDHSGVVAGGSLRLGGRDIAVIAKRPRRTRAAQWAIDFFRSARARRAWIKTWKLFVRGLPTEVPLLVLERRGGPVVTDNLVVFERVPGQTLERLALAELPALVRRDLLRQVGAVLRRTDQLGFTHLDAKTSNWIAFDDPAAGLRPVMLDCDGVRHHPAPAAGLRRFLKALSRHPQVGPADAHHLCDGYAPHGWSRRVRALHGRYAARP